MVPQETSQTCFPSSWWKEQTKKCYMENQINSCVGHKTFGLKLYPFMLYTFSSVSIINMNVIYLSSLGTSNFIWRLVVFWGGLM